MHASIETGAAPVFPPPAVPDLRRELLNLAEPIIADRINEAYADVEAEASQLRLWSVQHRRLWRAILLQHRSMMTTLTSELRMELGAAGLPSGFVDAVDQGVLEELVDITVKCFRSSHDKTRRCSLILLDAASFIGATRGNA